MAVWNKWVQELRERFFGNPEKRPADSAPKQKTEKTDRPQGGSAPAKPVPVQRELTEENLAKWRRLLQFVIEKLVESIRQNAEGHGKEESWGVGLKLDGTENRAFLVVERSASDPSLKMLSVQVLRAGHDRCVMNYMKNGTMEELLDYLTDEANLGELLDSIRHLSDRIDEMY